MEFVYCTREHLETIAGHVDHSRIIHDVAVIARDLTYAAALLDDAGQPIAAAGILPAWPGVGDAWALFTDKAMPRYRLTITRFAKGILDQHLADGTFQRLNAFVMTEAQTNIDWLEVLGFVKEGFHPNFGLHGQGDAISMGRV